MLRVLDNRVTFATSSDFTQRSTNSSKPNTRNSKKVFTNHFKILDKSRTFVKDKQKNRIKYSRATRGSALFFLNKLFTIRHENLTATICVSRDLQNFSNKIQLYKRALE